MDYRIKAYFLSGCTHWRQPVLSWAYLEVPGTSMKRVYDVTSIHTHIYEHSCHIIPWQLSKQCVPLSPPPSHLGMRLAHLLFITLLRPWTYTPILSSLLWMRWLNVHTHSHLHTHTRPSWVYAVLIFQGVSQSTRRPQTLFYQRNPNTSSDEYIISPRHCQLSNIVFHKSCLHEAFNPDPNPD